MAGEQSQFEGLLQNLLSTDNKIRVEAEVTELRVTSRTNVVCRFYIVGLTFRRMFIHFVFTARCNSLPITSVCSTKVTKLHVKCKLLRHIMAECFSVCCE